MARIHKALLRKKVKISSGAIARKKAFLRRMSSLSNMKTGICVVRVDHLCDGTTLDRTSLVQAQEDFVISELIQKIKVAKERLEEQTKRRQEQSQMMLDSMSQYYWKKPMKELNLAELGVIIAKIEEVQKAVDNEISIRSSSSAAQSATGLFEPRA